MLETGVSADLFSRRRVHFSEYWQGSTRFSGFAFIGDAVVEISDSGRVRFSIKCMPCCILRIWRIYDLVLMDLLILQSRNDLCMDELSILPQNIKHIRRFVNRLKAMCFPTEKAASYYRREPVPAGSDLSTICANTSYKYQNWDFVLILWEYTECYFSTRHLNFFIMQRTLPYGVDNNLLFSRKSYFSNLRECSMLCKHVLFITTFLTSFSKPSYCCAEFSWKLPGLGEQ